MLKAMQAVIEEVNKAGGVLGRKIETIVEDDQTNPEAAVRAARKLIEVDKVPVDHGHLGLGGDERGGAGVLGIKTFLCTVSGADSITQLPHQGYLIRTQPNSKLQATSHAEFIAGMGKKKVAVIGIQAPFALSTKEHLDNVLKTQRRQRRRAHHLREGQADLPLRDRPGDAAEARISSISTATRPTRWSCCAICSRPTSTCRSSPSPMPCRRRRSIPSRPRFRGHLHRPALGRYRQQGLQACRPAPRHGRARSYEAQATDWASLVILTVAKAKEATGTALKDNVRKISQGGGAEGLQRGRGPEAARRRQGDQLRGRLGPVRLHRHRRHPGLPLPLHGGGGRQAEVPKVV